MSSKGLDDGARVEAVERALTILCAFQGQGEALSLAEVARRTGFYKSTILRLAASLERMGFLHRDESGSFTLGPELPRLAALSGPGPDLEKLVRPKLEKLVKATQETASFYIREGQERICRFRENSPRAARHHLEEGVRLSLASGAAGRILLAFGEKPRRIDLPVRGRGWYVSLGERDPDVAAIAVPVIDESGHLWGALAVSGLRTRFSESFQKMALNALQGEAAALTKQLRSIQAHDKL
jgi:DNA-binding IclR family transcriptional regulator